MSFLIPPEAYPGRIAILFTLFLCTGITFSKFEIFWFGQLLTIFSNGSNFLVNTLNDVSEKSPWPKTDVVALVSWVQVCLCYIGAAMIEYTFLLGSNILISHLDKGSYCEKGLKLITQHLDKLIFLLFPVIFAITSYLFWKPLINS